MNLIGTKEASGRLGISQKRVQALIKNGQLPAQKVGRDWLIKENDLEKVAERKVGRPAKKESK
ncbi:MAG: helix-turn-helix domain-containing protein [Acidobacteriota bacterium]|nr:helix-turn-helix domain-containing protein [Acidobacteriota bacterium]